MTSKKVGFILSLTVQQTWISGGEIMKNQNLILARKAKGYTQDELALILNCKKTTISNWENGVSNPTLPIAFKLSEKLGQDINDLFLNLKVQESQTTNTA